MPNPNVFEPPDLAPVGTLNTGDNEISRHRLAQPDSNNGSGIRQMKGQKRQGIIVEMTDKMQYFAAPK